MARITALNVYPVKSCRGMPVQRARVTRSGFEHDREWLIVRPNGRFITQREQPKLALVETRLDGSTLHLRVPDSEALSIALAQAGREVEVTCWRDQCAAFDMGARAAEYLSAFLGEQVRLVRFDARRPRLSPAQWTQGHEAHARFADAFAWLVISEASLEDLNSRLPRPLPMNRFRPNIVVAGLPPYGEDEVHELVAGAVRLRAVKPCTRCIVTTTDQSSGSRDGDEPLRSLRQYRFNPQLKGVTFGQNLILIDGEEQELYVGQELQLTMRDSKAG